MFAGYRHCKKCGKALMGLFDGALCEECEKEENSRMTEPRCTNCRFFHRLKHNFERGKGFEESHCCTIMLKHETPQDITWVQEVEEDSRCELFTEKGKDE